MILPLRLEGRMILPLRLDNPLNGARRGDG